MEKPQSSSTLSSSFSQGTIDTAEFSLIQLVKNYPEIYNPLHEHYRDKIRRDAAWAAISRKLNKDERWCFIKWGNLNDYFRNRKKLYDSGMPATGKRWVYYDAMSFLCDIYDAQQHENNYSSNGVNFSFSELSPESQSENVEGCEEEDNPIHQPSYFDETQYQSLDGITERAALESVNKLLSLDLPAPAKRKRETSRWACPYNPRRSSRIRVKGGTRGAGHSVQRHSVSESTPLIVSVQSNAPPQLPPKPPNPRSAATSDAGNHGEEGGAPKAQKNVDQNLDDCPHSRFCMFLASRFRQMDDASAVYMQMKIMELFLKTEHPEEYNQRFSKD